MDSQNLVMLPRDAPTDVLNELQLVQEFYGADTPADHQRVMALFAPNAQLDLPQMFVKGRDNISAIMFYAKTFIADVDIEPYMVEIGTGCANGIGPQHTGPNTTSTAQPASSTTSTDSTGSTCTSAATSKRRRAKPPKAPSGSAGPSNGSSRQQPSRLARKHGDPHRPRSRQQHSDATTALDQQDGATAQNHHHSARMPESMSQTHVYAVATITPKSLLRLLSLNLLPRSVSGSSGGFVGTAWWLWQCWNHVVVVALVRLRSKRQRVGCWLPAQELQQCVSITTATATVHATPHQWQHQ
jgi:hypothetical protein